MKRLNLTILLAAGLFTAIAAAAAADDVGKQTRKNLDTALHDEAYVQLKYLAYAKRARSTGHAELAQAFEETANVEAGKHFAREAERLGLADSDGNNILNAMAGEYSDFNQMYLDFARQAEDEGDKKSAEMFRQIAADEQEHFERFKQQGFKLGEPPAKETAGHGKDGQKKN
jgi:rubrerythrin